MYYGSLNDPQFVILYGLSGFNHELFISLMVTTHVIGFEGKEFGIQMMVDVKSLTMVVDGGKEGK